MAKKIISKANLGSKDDFQRSGTTGTTNHQQQRRYLAAPAQGVPANPYYQSSLRSLPHSSSSSDSRLANGISLAPSGGENSVTMFKTKVLYHSNGELSGVARGGEMPNEAQV